MAGEFYRPLPCFRDHLDVDYGLQSSGGRQRGLYLVVVDIDDLHFDLGAVSVHEHASPRPSLPSINHN